MCVIIYRGRQKLPKRAADTTLRRYSSFGRTIKKNPEKVPEANYGGLEL